MFLRRLFRFDRLGIASLAIWLVRAKSGVHADAIPVSYHRAQAPLLWALVVLMIVETAVVEFVLRVMNCPDVIRIALFVIGVYGILIGLAVLAACATRPHVVADGTLRIRYGVFFDVTIPRERIVAVRAVAKFDEEAPFVVDGSTFAVAVASRTNIVVDFDETIAVTRPLGKTFHARSIRFFADDQQLALRSLADPVRAVRCDVRQVRSFLPRVAALVIGLR